MQEKLTNKRVPNVATSLKTLIPIARLTTSLIHASIAQCRVVEEQLSLFDRLLGNFKDLLDEAAELNTQEKPLFENVIKELLTHTLDFHNSIESTSIDKKAINILAFSTVMQFLSSMPDYVYFFQKNHSSLLDMLYDTFELSRKTNNHDIKLQATISFVCFCHVMLTRTQLLYFNERVEYDSFFHNEIAPMERINNLIELKKLRPDLSLYVTSALQELAHAHISISRLQFIKSHLEDEDRRHFSSLIRSIIKFIKKHTRQFIIDSLEKITTADQLEHFNHVYTSLTQLPMTLSAGRAELQQYLATILICDFDDQDHIDSVKSVFYNALSRDKSWQTFAYNQAKSMETFVKNAVTESKGYQAWMYHSMQSWVRPPTFFCILPKHGPHKNTIPSVNSLDALAPNP